MKTENVGDFDIQALVDNELGREEEKRIRAFLERNYYARKRYEELLSQKTRLKSWWLRDKH